MRNALFALIIAAVLVGVATGQASATSYFQLRINPATSTWQDKTVVQFIDLPVDFNSPMLGGTIFLQLPTRPWGLRLNFDTASLDNFRDRGAPSGYDGGRWTYYDISLGHHLMIGRGSAVVFLGYGHHRADFNIAGPVATQQDMGGFVFGADFYHPIGSSPFYVTATAAFGPGMQYKYTNFPPGPTRAEGSANSTVYGAGFGYRPAGGMTSVEVGWRSGGFSVSRISSGDAVVDGQDVRWQGIYLGLKVVR